jgi:hypothetical protein
MPLPIIGPTEYRELRHKAIGPFSYRFLLNSSKDLMPEVIAFTSYILPDGGWNWAVDLAACWTPELSGYPPAELPDFPEAEKSL